MGVSVKIDLRLSAQSPLHIGMGLGFGGILDDTVVKNAHRIGERLYPQAYVPGSTLKGRLRHYFQHAQQLLPHLSQTHNQQACRHQALVQCCAECRIFGSKLHQAPFRFPDAALVPELTELSPDAMALLQTMQRTGTRLSRSRRVVKERHLYTIEVASEVLTFQTTISGNVELTSHNADALNASEIALLLLACRLMEQLGGFKTAGLGKVRVTVEQVRVNGQVRLNGQADVDEHLRRFWIEGGGNP